MPASRTAAPLLLLLWSAVAAGPAGAQAMREYTASRPMRGERQVNVHLEFAAGALRLLPAAAGTLYRIEARYDTERFDPVTRYDAASGALALGLAGRGAGGIRVTSRRQLDQQAGVWLSPEVELGLTLNLGAAESRIDLGGLRLRNLALRMEGSRTQLAFSRPGVGHCREAVLEVGAGDMVVERFGNAGCRRLRLSGGVGRVSLDLGGQLADELTADLSMTLGELTLRLPQGAGVRLTLDRFLASFQPAGFVRQGGQFVTPDFETAARRLDLRVSSSVGAVKVVWY